MPDFTIIGPGALSAADPGVLERVAERRIRNEWGLDGLEAGAVLIAPASCDLLGKRGWLIAGGEVHRVQVVDCENGNHAGEMAERGILADVSEPGLAHERGWVILE